MGLRVGYRFILSPPSPSTWGPLESIAERYRYDVNHNLRYDALARQIRLHQIGRLVVLGCGKGVLESILPGDVETVSVDISREELLIAREINHGMVNRHFVRADIFHLPFRNGFRTEMVVISEVLEHVEHDERVLESAHRLLLPNGLLLLTVPNFQRLINWIVRLLGRQPYFMSEDHLREYSLQEAAKLQLSAGFVPLIVVPIYLRMAMELRLRRRMSVADPFRRLFLFIFPRLGTYLLFLSRRAT